MALSGWHPLPDGREGLYIDGACLAAIRHDPALRTPFVTEAFAPDGSRSLRNLDTRADAVAHCERVVSLVTPSR